MSERIKWLLLGMVILLVMNLGLFFLSGCLTPQQEAMREAQFQAQQRDWYVPQNMVDARNYDWRLRISDDPSLIVWCTMFPTTPGLKPVTVPIAGKLTSGGKRPFPTEPDAQGMWGSSGEYRFGFGPSGMYEYYDIYGMETFCTTMPMLWQAQLTIIVQEKSDVLVNASAEARTALQKGDTDLASQILNNAIRKVQGGE